jgi:polyisoprenyl-teichoic acid--peptidoglycan teichoic acid transferase
MGQLFQRFITKIKIMDRVTKVILLVFLILALVTSVLTFNFVRSFTSSMTMFNLPGAPVIDQSQTNSLGETAAPQTQLNQPTAQPWNGVSRVTLLILGLDYRDWQKKEIPRSDTMILLTLDPVTNTAGILSIPRDLWVNIPNFGFGKINEAFFLGEANHLPGGGPQLATETIEQLLGIPINFYTQVDFTAFIKFIDTVGGVVVIPKENVPVQDWGSEYKQTLTAGKAYTLSGGLALSYARERYSGKEGDVARAARQQQVIEAIRTRILKLENLPGLIAKAPTIYQELSAGIHTNINNLQEAIQLGLLAMQINPASVKKGVIDFNMMIPAKSPEGLDILIPIMDKIRTLRDEIFSTGGAQAPIASPSANSTLVRDEAARIAIQNGTPNTGLAGKTSQYLRDQGMNIVQEANANQNIAITTIYIYNSKPYTLKFIADLMKVQPTNIWNKFDPNVGADILIMLGNDWATNNPLPQ